MRAISRWKLSFTTYQTPVGVDVAPWQQFGVGGANTVRGWDFAARRGKNQMLNTAELQVVAVEPRSIGLPFGLSFRGGVQLAVFGDLGVAWNESSAFASEHWIGGAGLGVRFLVPLIGMIRTEFAYGQSGEGLFVHLSAFEKPVMTRRRVR